MCALVTGVQTCALPISRHPRFDRRYAKISADKLPDTECLKDTVERVLPFWNESIAPAMRAGRRVLIAAHGNSLRALIKHLDGISDRSEEHTSELQSLMRISYAVFCLKKKITLIS